LPAVFDVFDKWFRRSDFQGCSFAKCCSIAVASKSNSLFFKVVSIGMVGNGAEIGAYLRFINMAQRRFAMKPSQPVLLALTTLVTLSGCAALDRQQAAMPLFTIGKVVQG
jgi:hypothetical protein